MSVSHFSFYFIIFFKLPAFKAPVKAVIDKFGSCSSVNSVARLVVDVGINSSDQNLLNLSPLTLTHYQDDDSGNWDGYHEDELSHDAVLQRVAGGGIWRKMKEEQRRDNQWKKRKYKKVLFYFFRTVTVMIIKVSNRGILLTNDSENSAEDSHLQSQPN